MLSLFCLRLHSPWERSKGKVVWQCHMVDRVSFPFSHFSYITRRLAQHSTGQQQQQQPNTYSYCQADQQVFLKNSSSTSSASLVLRPHGKDQSIWFKTEPEWISRRLSLVSRVHTHTHSAGEHARMEKNKRRSPERRKKIGSRAGKRGKNSEEN